MKVAKQILAVIGILIVLLILAAVMLPVIFKDRIINYAKAEANKHVNARLDFDNDINLSIFRSFPDFSIGVNNLKIINKAPFDGDTLIVAPELHATLDVMSVIRGEKIAVKSFILNRPHINLLVMPDGTSNWDIAIKTKKDLAKEGKDTTSNFRMALKHYELNDARIIYDDKSTKFYLAMDSLTHTGSGDFTQDIFDLETRSRIGKTSMAYAGTPYLSRVRTLLDAKLHIDMPRFRFEFKENELQLNALILGFNGFWEWPGKDMNMDLTFKAKQTDFKNLLSLIPAVYAKDFSRLKTTGTMAFNGEVKGAYGDSAFPGFKLNLAVDNGMFQYPDLPSPVTNVFVDAHVSSPGGDLNNTVIDIPKANFIMAGDPFSARLNMRTPVKTPYVDGALKGRINLANIQKVVKLESGTAMSGILNADVAMKGYLSSVEKGQYEKLDAKGYVAGENIKYNSKEMPMPVSVSSTRLDFTPVDVKLSPTSLALGNSDAQISGSLHNVMSYVLKDQLLTGTMNLSSNFFDVNPWMKKDGGSKESQPMKPTDLPGNLDFTMNADMKQVVYDNMNLRDLKGTIVIRDKRLSLQNMAMNTLGGNIKATGYYDSKNIRQPETDMTLSISQLSIPETFRTFASVQQFLPIAKYMSGNVSANLSLKTLLDNDMKPVWKSFFSQGVLDIPKATVENYLPLTELGNKLDISRFNKIAVFNIKPSYKIQDGRFFLNNPLKFNFENIKAEVTGSSGLDKTLDYKLALDLPSDEVKKQLTAGALGDLFRKNNIPVPIGQTVRVNALIGGTIDKPDVRVSLKEFAESTLKNAKDIAKDIANKKINEVKTDVNKELDAKKKQILDAAQQKADMIKQQAKSAADKVRQEGYNQAQDIEDRAKGNPLGQAAAKIAADKLRKETDNKANQIENEGNQKADQIMNEARQQADNLKVK